MKNSNLIFAMLALLVLMSSSCMKDKCKRTVTYSTFDPVYLSYDEARSSVAVEEARNLEETGKLYFTGDFILINEYLEGVHIIDNSDPSNPSTVAFLKIPGNVDVAMKGSRLFADSGPDLLTFDFSNPINPVLIDRQENALPYPHFMQVWADQSQGVVIAINETVHEDVVEYDCGTSAPVPNVGGGFGGGIAFDNQFNDMAAAESAPSQSGGGSMARFTVAQDYLYVVSNTSLLPFNVSSGVPSEEYSQQIGWGIETIFPFKDKLFIGSTTGMLIYDISNGGQPVELGRFDHVNSCDPVVANEDYAFVTLRSENVCRGVDRLDLLDINDLMNPELLLSCDMSSPKGLGLDGDHLFVCDDGIKVYDISDPLQLCESQIVKTGDDGSFDLIPRDGLLMVVGEDGFYQYDYTNIDDIRLLSVINVNRQ